MGRALATYDEAIEWTKKSGQDHTIGSTLHQKGRVFQETRRWDEALDTFDETIEWDKKMGQDHEIGGTLHHKGMVFEETRRWNEALAAYEEAIEWDKKTGQDHEIGNTLHQKGMVFEKIRRLEEALASFEEAIEWNKKTGQDHKLGSTFMLKGMVLKEMGRHDDSFNSLLAGVGNFLRFELDREKLLGVCSHFFQLISDMPLSEEQQARVNELMEQYPLLGQVLENLLKASENNEQPDSKNDKPYDAPPDSAD